MRFQSQRWRMQRQGSSKIYWGRTTVNHGCEHILTVRSASELLRKYSKENSLGRLQVRTGQSTFGLGKETYPKARIANVLRSLCIGLLEMFAILPPLPAKQTRLREERTQHSFFVFPHCKGMRIEPVTRAKGFFVVLYGIRASVHLPKLYGSGPDSSHREHSNNLYGRLSVYGPILWERP